MHEYDVTGARAVVQSLCRHGMQWYRNPPNKVWQDTFESVGERFAIHQGVEAVEATFLCEENGEIDGPYILLAPPQKSPNIVCLLGIYWDLGDDESHMSLYLNMFGPLAN